MSVMINDLDLRVALTSIANRVDIGAKGKVRLEAIDQSLMRLGLR